MKLYYTAILSLLFIAANGQNPWTKTVETDIIYKSDSQRNTIPDTYETFALDYKEISKILSKSPHEKSNRKVKDAVKCPVPMPDGSIEMFRFYESPCMSPVLSEKYPGIKSYRGYSEHDPSKQVRLDLGYGAFHAVIKTSEGVAYIDPYFFTPDKHYLSYWVRDHKVDVSAYSQTCGIEAYNASLDPANVVEEDQSYKSVSVPVVKRTYRMALACTALWGSIYGNVETVLSRMNTGVNRLNMIFENELAVKFELIDNNDELVFVDRNNEPYTNPNRGGSCLAENTNILNNRVGSNAYDIGHVFTVFCTDGVAGIAYLASLCQGNKGGGVSCVGTSSITNFMVQTTAHELGHQFSGGHSWNSCPNAQGQFSSGTSWEPGSGSTILSYAGSCGSDNIASRNDDYFHVGNIGQFRNLISAVSCGVEEDSGNNTPEINWDYSNGFFIPISTPFELEAEANDPDGDAMTYNWEQMNTGPVSSLGSPMGNAPSFRSFPPDERNFRIFPRLSTILFNTNDRTEVLPTYDRNLSFRFVVRDNHPGAGAMVWRDLSFNATSEAGPFVITSPASDVFVGVNEELLIEWNVANTDGEKVNCQTVDIYLSTDNGQNFDILLAENTPNDGAHAVRMPNIITNNARVKVKASNNIFFNIARPSIIIREPTQPGYFIDLSEPSLDVCLPEVASVDVMGTSFQGFTNPVMLDVVSGLPEGAAYSFSDNPIDPDGTSTLDIDLNNVRVGGEFEVEVRAVSQDADTLYQTLIIKATGTNYDDLTALSPASGLAGVNGTPEFVWTSAANADAYNLEVSTNPSFDASSIIVLDNISDTLIIPQIAIPNSNLYYWRVTAFNKCSTESTEIRTFGTVSLSCRTFEAEDLPKNISASGRPTISSLIEIFDEGSISDVNVTKIKAVHQRVQDLKVSLISPAETRVILFENRCFGSNFNIGFDSQSPVEFSCNLNTGIQMKPELDDLSKLNGESIRGEWYLEVADTEAGEGGQFQEFVLELCSDAILDPPFLINNNIVDVPVGFSEGIRTHKLLTEDANNGPDQLIYTLVQLPSEGSVQLDGEVLEIGSQFTQEDIDAELLRYVHEGVSETVDSFVFTVIDGEGGWIDLTPFIIEVSDDATSTDDQDTNDIAFDIYPNPATEQINILNRNRVDSGHWVVKLYGLDGRVYRQQALGSVSSVDVRDLSRGMYIMELSSDEGHRHVEKLSIQ